MTASELDSYLKTVLVDRKQKQRKNSTKRNDDEVDKGRESTGVGAWSSLISRMMAFVLCFQSYISNVSRFLTINVR